jgi:predicted lipoprotein with Yx(FWY)xxD motif/cytochrome c553
MILLITAIASALAFAQESTAAMNVAQHEEHGTYLTDTNGNSLYLFLNDQQGEESNCADTCAQSWPPFLTGGELIAAEGVDESLLGTVRRSDGTTQVTYNGWPVYYFIRDKAPGDTLGQGVGTVWHLVSPTGRGIGTTDAEEAIHEEVMVLGAEAFHTHCSSCHGVEGGGVGDLPRLANNSGLMSLDLVLGQIMRGGDYMPAFQNVLDDGQIAAIATFIRNSWNNGYGPVSVEEVALRR